MRIYKHETVIDNGVVCVEHRVEQCSECEFNWYDSRVTELQHAVNRETERRRTAEAELARINDILRGEPRLEEKLS